MSIKVGINGFGRIGRLFFRSTFENPSLKDLQIIAINDLITVDYMAYMLRYDSVHGPFKGDIDIEKDQLIVNGSPIEVMSRTNAEDLSWGDLGVDYVVESTGLYLTRDKASAHLKAGAKKVILSAPSKDETPIFVMGVNQWRVSFFDVDCVERFLHHELSSADCQDFER